MNIEITGAIYCWENRDDRKMQAEWWKRALEKGSRIIPFLNIKLKTKCYGRSDYFIMFLSSYQ